MTEEELIKQIKKEVLKELKEWAALEIRNMFGKMAA